MLTIFSTCKPFKGHFATIQRNAITSWTKLLPKPEIILFGDEEGTEEICKELGLRHIPKVSKSKSNAPYMDEVFKSVEANTNSDLFCYVNADIILLSDFMKAVNQVDDFNRKFLMVARRWNVNIDHVWDFKEQNWEEKLKQYVIKNGSQALPPGLTDFLVYPKGLWKSIINIPIGRSWWDAWLIYEAVRLGAELIDCSEVVMPIHQEHDYSTYPFDLRTWRREISENYEFIGEDARDFSLFNASYLLTNKGLKRPFGIHYFTNYLNILKVIHPNLSFLSFIFKSFAKPIRIIKEKLSELFNPMQRLRKMIYSKLPENGITSILGLKDSGLSLAYLLTRGGYPIIAYDSDPKILEEAKRKVGGPVKFTSSINDCLSDTDVVVIASLQEETSQILYSSLSKNGDKKTVIDWHGSCKQLKNKKDISYILCK